MATKTTKTKTLKPATKKAAKGKASKPVSKPPKTTMPALKTWLYEVEQDANFTDNYNLTFLKPNNAAWTKEDHKEVDALVKKLMLDPEPIMDGMYSFDALMVEMVKRELLAAGLTEHIEVSDYLPDISDPPEPTDACGGCGGSCDNCSNPTP